MNKCNNIRQTDLCDYLYNKQKKAELIDTGRCFGAKGSSSWNKQMLAKSIEYRLTMQPECLIRRMPLDEMRDLQKLIHAGGCIPNTEGNPFKLENFRMRGFVLDVKEDNQTYFVITENFRKALLPVIDKLVEMPDAKLWDKKERIISGLLNIYGIATIKGLARKYNGLTNDGPISDEDLLLFYAMRDKLLLGANLLIINNKYYLSSFFVESPQDMFEMIQQRKDLKDRKFTLEEILKAGISYYIPDFTQARRLENYLINNHIPPETAKMILRISWEMIQNEYPTGEVASQFTQIFKFDEINNLVPVIMDYINNSPHWSMKGNIPQELFLQQKN